MISSRADQNEASYSRQIHGHIGFMCIDNLSFRQQCLIRLSTLGACWPFRQNWKKYWLLQIEMLWERLDPTCLIRLSIWDACWSSVMNSRKYLRSKSKFLRSTELTLKSTSHNDYRSMWGFASQIFDTGGLKSRQIGSCTAPPQTTQKYEQISVKIEQFRDFCGSVWNVFEIVFFFLLSSMWDC